jgi:hypothetical protein
MDVPNPEPSFNWKSSHLAVQRIREAVAEITTVMRHDALLAADGSVRADRETVACARTRGQFVGFARQRRLWADRSALIPVIAAAPTPSRVREKWLDRLFQAHGTDKVPYLESLTDHWPPRARRTTP